jgi:hypothetical protein
MRDRLAVITTRWTTVRFLAVPALTAELEPISSQLLFLDLRTPVVWPEPRRNKRVAEAARAELCADASLAATQALAESDDAADGYEAAASSAETAASACS